jgi:hypothetical protein
LKLDPRCRHCERRRGHRYRWPPTLDS